MARCMGVKPVEFKFYAPQAKRVSLAGNFNKWDTSALSAKKDSKGNWVTKVNLRPGRYEYKFIVDGTWLTDPRCINYSTNAFGTQNCVIDIK